MPKVIPQFPSVKNSQASTGTVKAQDSSLLDSDGDGLPDIAEKHLEQTPSIRIQTAMVQMI